MSKRIAFAVAVAICGPVLVQAAPVTARGTFSTEGRTLKVVDAFAYEDKDGGINLRLSGTAFDRAALSSVIDFEREILRQAGELNDRATLQFTKEARYRGASYTLGDNSCGFCGYGGAAAKAAVKLEGGSLKGTIRIAPADYGDGKGAAIDLTLDVPVASVTGTTALPAGGGDAAQALERCRQVVKKADAAAFKGTCLMPGDARVAQATEDDPNADVESILIFYYGESRSLKLNTMKVTGGRTRGDWAELSVEGSGELGKLTGSVFLRKAGGSWRFHHDRLSEVF